ncbi:hypothetical protein KKB55_15810, partial [Myxococcota bacterium]|nr:hypothetical protein [Myxococcota bacterium]
DARPDLAVDEGVSPDARPDLAVDEGVSPDARPDLAVDGGVSRDARLNHDAATSPGGDGGDFEAPNDGDNDSGCQIRPGAAPSAAWLLALLALVACPRRRARR